MGAAPKLSVIIVSWNASELLRACLLTLPRRTQEFPFEVIVIDNASNDGSPEMVAAEFPEVRLLRNPENVGFARANEQAAALASGEYLLLLNPDTVLREPDVLRGGRQV
jgi:GT2 family glycosyltransferase